MNETYSRNLNSERHEESTMLPVVEDDRDYPMDKSPSLESENQIISYLQYHRITGDERRCFALLKKIDGLNYIIRLISSSSEQGYSLSFFTKEYEYATVNLSSQDHKELFETISRFLESILQYDNLVTEIKISPAGASYSAEQIERCISEIVSSPDSEFTREELMDHYRGFEVFELYEKIFSRDFHREHYNLKSRAAARSRFFKMMIRKYLPKWEIIQGLLPFSYDFSLKRLEDNRRYVD